METSGKHRFLCAAGFSYRQSHHQLARHHGHGDARSWSTSPASASRPPWQNSAGTPCKDTDLGAIFDKTVELVTRALEVPFSTVTEVLPGGEQLLLRAACGWREQIVGQRVQSWRSKMPNARWDDTEPVIITDLREPALARNRSRECRP